jgi:two-component system, OmpR family, sensor histidine kinase CreC
LKGITQLFLGYLTVLVVAGYFLVSGALDEIKPAMRQSSEETLVDTANLLAELVRDRVAQGQLATSDFGQSLQAYAERQFNAEIFGVAKTRASLHIYITDDKGVVLFDSQNRDIGRDYSRWNDVYLTLRGKYGARSTRSDPNDETSTVMYVAAPITQGDNLLGVVSVGKHNRSAQPLIDRTQRRIVLGSAITVLGTTMLAIALSFWLSRSLAQLVRYTREVGAGRRVSLPRLRGPEIRELGVALADMRDRLEGKAYVENYAQALTHELKSPLAAIRASAELIEEELAPADRRRFARTIQAEASRIQQLAERLLGLAFVEHRQAPVNPVAVSLHDVVAQILATHAATIRDHALSVENRVAVDAIVKGEHFLLQQALENLFINALDFAPVGGRITCRSDRNAENLMLSCHNTGPAIPDYALPRVTERFFSLPRAESGRKSSGLGLSLVAQVAELHGGRFEINNAPEGGVVARIVLPCPTLHPSAPRFAPASLAGEG